MKFLNVPLALAIGLLFITHPQINAQATDANSLSENSFFDMSLEELIEIPLVISASRQEQQIGRLSVPVSVLTAEDIHYSGLTSISDILRYIPGVDVRTVDRNRQIVGVRGFHSGSSDRTLVLLNGQDISDPFNARIRWNTLAINTEDIERIEVVRGPAGAAWGANAATGVINIITKKPEDIDPGWLFSSTINEYGDNNNYARWTGQKDDWSWRFSYSYEDMEDADAAGAGQKQSGIPPLNFMIGYDSYNARDYATNHRFDFQTSNQISEVTRFSFGASYIHQENGSYEFAGVFPEEDQLTSSTRLSAKLEHDFENGISGYITWYSHYMTLHEPSLLSRYVLYQNTLEGQLDIEVSDTHKMAVGAYGKINRIDVEDGPILAYEGDPTDELWYGLFLTDRIDLTDRLTWENQIRADYFDVTGWDWSLRTAGIYALDDEKDHNLRLSFARSFRAAPTGVRETTSSSLYGMYTTILPQDEINNERTWIVEAGYHGKLSNKVTFELNGYYQRFDALIGTQSFSNVVYFENITGANAYGGEAELKYEDKTKLLSVWYAHNNMGTDTYNPVIRGYQPARHKVGIRGRYHLNEQWTANANYAYNNDQGFNDGMFTSHYVDHRLDLTLSRKFNDGNGELMVGVTDLFNDTQEATLDIGEFISHELPGRTFFARLQYKF